MCVCVCVGGGGDRGGVTLGPSPVICKSPDEL